LDSSNYYTYFSLALYHINKNDYYTAIDFFNKINESQFFNQIKLDYISDTDTEPLYYYQYSLALMNTNNEELAKSVIKKARDLFPNKNNIEELYIEIFNIIPVDTTSSY
jgi:tetratricopeptide (TPR) repeat protein